jgi:hypothetical protein
MVGQYGDSMDITIFPPPDAILFPQTWPLARSIDESGEAEFINIFSNLEWKSNWPLELPD